MAYYLQTAEELRKEVKGFLETYSPANEEHAKDMARTLGHIVNLAIRCNPRQPQGTVRRNIVATAMKDYCLVTMTRETDEKTSREFNKIHISAI